MSKQKKQWYRRLLGSLIVVGVATGTWWGLSVSAAATQTSTATTTSTTDALPVLSNDKFNEEMKAPVDDDGPVSQVFPDKNLAKAVGEFLAGSGSDGLNINVKKRVDLIRSGEKKDPINSDGYWLTISPDVTKDGAPIVSEHVKDWTGLSALKGILGGLIVCACPELKDNLADMMMYLADREAPQENTFWEDDLGNKELAEFVSLGTKPNQKIYYQSMDLSRNPITDVSPMNAFKGFGDIITMNNLSGAAQDTPLEVEDSSVVIKGGLPGQRFLPLDYVAKNPLKIVRLENGPDSESPTKDDYMDEMYHRPTDGEIKHPSINDSATFDQMVAAADAYNLIDFTDRGWRTIWPFGQKSDLNSMPATVDLDKLVDLKVVNIPKGTKSLTFQTLWGQNDYASLTNRVTIPLIWPSATSSSSSSSSSDDSKSTSSADTSSKGTSSKDTSSKNTSSKDSSTSGQTSSQSSSTSRHSSSQATSFPASGQSASRVSSSSSQVVASTSQVNPPVAKRGAAVYALKKVGLYRQPTFTKAARKCWYVKQPRTKRPQFVVQDYVYSKHGILRYLVKDVNHQSKTDGQTGYLTTDETYVVNTYYQRAPKQVRVIGKQGINAYRNADLTGKRVQHYRRGQLLHVKKLVNHHLTTRLVLTNGQIITGNKTLIIAK